MNKILKITLWVLFFFVSIYSLIVIDRWFVYSKVPVLLSSSSYFVDMWDEGFVNVDGKILENKGNYYDDLNVIKVTCQFSKKQCIHSIGGLFKSTQTSEFPPLLNVKTEQYLITNWTKDILIYQDFDVCSDTTFTLVRNTKTLTGVKKYLKKNSNCQREDEITYTIVSGFDYVMKEQKEVRNVFLNTLLFLIVSFITIFGIYKTVRKKP